jgi:hypothetical protein
VVVVMVLAVWSGSALRERVEMSAAADEDVALVVVVDDEWADLRFAVGLLGSDIQTLRRTAISVEANLGRARDQVCVRDAVEDGTGSGRATMEGNVEVIRLRARAAGTSRRARGSTESVGFTAGRVL